MNTKTIKSKPKMKKIYKLKGKNCFKIKSYNKKDCSNFKNGRKNIFNFITNMHIVCGIRQDNKEK